MRLDERSKRFFEYTTLSRYFQTQNNNNNSVLNFPIKQLIDFCTYILYTYSLYTCVECSLRNANNLKVVPFDSDDFIFLSVCRPRYERVLKWRQSDYHGAVPCQAKCKWDHRGCNEFKFRRERVEGIVSSDARSEVPPLYVTARQQPNISANVLHDRFHTIRSYELGESVIVIVVYFAT